MSLVIANTRSLGYVCVCIPARSTPRPHSLQARTQDVEWLTPEEAESDTFHLTEPVSPVHRTQQATRMREVRMELVAREKKRSRQGEMGSWLYRHVPMRCTKCHLTALAFPLPPLG